MLSPVIILGCIYSGVASPTEAAVISVFYSLIVSIFIYKSLPNKKVYDVFVEEEEAYPKDLKLNKVHMRTHRRSGLLISKFAL